MWTVKEKKKKIKKKKNDEIKDDKKQYLKLGGRGGQTQKLIKVTVVFSWCSQHQ